MSGAPPLLPVVIGPPARPGIGGHWRLNGGNWGSPVENAQMAARKVFPPSLCEALFFLSGAGCFLQYFHTYHNPDRHLGASLENSIDIQAQSNHGQPTRCPNTFLVESSGVTILGCDLALYLPSSTSIGPDPS